MLLCPVSCVGILARSSCTIAMQKFEVGEMYIVGRPTISCNGNDFESDYNYNTCIFSKFHFLIISAKEIRGLTFSGKLNSNKV